MPIVRVPVAGSDIFASASVFKRKTLTIPAAAGGVPGSNALADMAIQCNNLPNAFLYILQTGGLVGCAFIPYFAVDNTTGAQPNWLPLTAGQAIFLNTPLFTNFRVVATMLSVQVSNPTAQAATLEVVVAASQ